jgi:hypothetical protein
MACPNRSPHSRRLSRTNGSGRSCCPCPPRASGPTIGRLDSLPRFPNSDTCSPEPLARSPALNSALYVHSLVPLCGVVASATVKLLLRWTCGDMEMLSSVVQSAFSRKFAYCCLLLLSAICAHALLPFSSNNSLRLGSAFSPSTLDVSIAQARRNPVSAQVEADRSPGGEPSLHILTTSLLALVMLALVHRRTSVPLPASTRFSWQPCRACPFAPRAPPTR